MMRFQPTVEAVLRGTAVELVLVAIVLVATYAVVRVGAWLAPRLDARLPGPGSTLTRLVPVMRIALWLLAAYLVLVGVFRPSREALLVFAAAAGIGVGLAARDVLRSLIGGLVIALTRPFQVGDRIEVGAVQGEVVGIGPCATRVLTRDDVIVSVPNAEVVRRPVGNASRGAAGCAVVVDLMLPYGVDTVEVRRIGHEAAATSPYVLPARPITVHLEDAFEGAFLTRVRIRAYVYDHRLESVFVSDVTERARRGLHEAGWAPGPLASGGAREAAGEAPAHVLARGGAATPVTGGEA